MNTPTHAHIPVNVFCFAIVEDVSILKNKIGLEEERKEEKRNANKHTHTTYNLFFT